MIGYNPYCLIHVIMGINIANINLLKNQNHYQESCIKLGYTLHVGIPKATMSTKEFFKEKT